LAVRPVVGCCYHYQVNCSMIDVETGAVAGSVKSL